MLKSRSINKKAIQICLILIVINVINPALAFGHNDFLDGTKGLAPKFQSFNEFEDSGMDLDRFIVEYAHNISPYSDGQYEYVKAYSFYDLEVFISYHPDYPEPLNADGYWFSTSNKATSSFTIGYGPISVTYDRTSGASGYFILVDGGKAVKSRPYIEADLEVTVYDLYIYDDIGNLITIIRGHSYGARAISTRIKIKENL